MSCDIGFIGWIPQSNVSVKEFGTSRDPDGIFNGNIAASRGAAIFGFDGFTGKEKVSVVSRADNAQKHSLSSIRVSHQGGGKGSIGAGAGIKGEISVAGAGDCILWDGGKDGTIGRGVRGSVLSPSCGKCKGKEGYRKAVDEWAGAGIYGNECAWIGD